jgi:hypothetical protein
MDETSRNALDVFRSDDNVAWIADQLITSFSEGIAHSAKDGEQVLQRDLIESMGLSSREKTKREKYETSRPYEEPEKLELVKFALEEVFVTLPLMQEATEQALRELGTKATAIEFLAPDEEERQQGSYKKEFGADNKNRINDLKQRLLKFSESLSI